MFKKFGVAGGGDVTVNLNNIACVEPHAENDTQCVVSMIGGQAFICDTPYVHVAEELLVWGRRH